MATSNELSANSCKKRSARQPLRCLPERSQSIKRMVRREVFRICHSAGGELEQIQFLLGHRSVETTERYLGSRQRLVQAVNDHIGIERWTARREPFNLRSRELGKKATLQEAPVVFGSLADKLWFN